jgi:hypothetical protein
MPCSAGNFYAQQKEIAKQKIREKLGEEIIVHQQNEILKWKVVEESHVDVEKDSMDVGIQDMNLHDCSHGEVFAIF